jgi:hypothetical protein
LLSLVAIPFLVVRAEEPIPQGFDHWSPAFLQRVAQALATEAAADPHHFAVKQLSDFANEAFLLVHREADGQLVLDGAHEFTYLVIKVKGY